MKKNITESQLNMWRSIVALIHADGRVHEEEDRFLREAFKKLPLTLEQKNILETDLSLTTEASVDEYFSQITEPKDRAHFIYFARLLFWCDGDFHSQEDEIFQRLQGDVISRVDLKKVMESVEKVVENYQYEQKNRGFRQVISDFVLRILCD